MKEIKIDILDFLNLEEDVTKRLLFTDENGLKFIIMNVNDIDKDDSFVLLTNEDDSNYYVTKFNVKESSDESNAFYELLVNAFISSDLSSREWAVVRPDISFKEQDDEIVYDLGYETEFPDASNLGVLFRSLSKKSLLMK